MNIAPAIIVLNQNSVAIARKIAAIFPSAKIYGLVDRTSEVDISFSSFGDTLRQLFSSNQAIIGICASGILIRTLAPLLKDKWSEPPVLAVAEDGSAVVPLLGGLQGVNDLARNIAEIFNISPAITTTGDIRFRTTLLSPPEGYYLANPESAKTFIADLLSSATLKIEGIAPWLYESKLPISDSGNLVIKITEKAILHTENCLIYHPKTVIIKLADQISQHPKKAVEFIQQKLKKDEISLHAIAGIFALDTSANYTNLEKIASAFKVPVRFVSAKDSELPQIIGATGQVIFSSDQISIGVAIFPIDINSIGRARGKLAIIGIGPGKEDWMSPEVTKILTLATDWVGYKTYLDLVEPCRKNQQRHESDNRVEIERAKTALNLAYEGRKVAVISSGDPGIFAMAAAVFEALERENKPEWQSIDIQVCPGISAMQAAASLVGAPLGHDFCAISLSDILKPWQIIEQRIEAVAKADFVIAFYNPVSKQRTWQLEKARDMILKYRNPETPIILARNLGRVGQSVEITRLDRLNSASADMRTVILIGSSQTRLVSRQDGNHWVYTPRCYEKNEVRS